MNGENINKINKKPRILLAPLDWGLGHATRCIPIITTLLRQGAEVLLAAEGATGSLLKKEFPGVVILPLKGYKIRYSSSKSLFVLKMVRQLPKMIAAVNHEKNWLDKMISRHGIDAVISDNRFGLYSNRIPCVYITHQLFIETGIAILNRTAQKTNYRYIRNFNECWIPDLPGENNLAGKLSHPDILPGVPMKYLGILSRCKKIEAEKKYAFLFMFSGPEPQRTIFENILLKQLKEIRSPIVIVRGLPGSNEQPEPAIENTHITLYNHLPAEELNVLIQQSLMVIARCGYSTVMDLVTLQQKAILVPTPGQTEQEYLARYLKEKKLFFTTRQEGFNLKKAVEEAGHFNFNAHEILPLLNENIIIDWLQKINE